VKDALTQLGINGLTVSEVRGYGRQKGHKEVYRGAEYEIDLTPKIKVELVVASARAEEVIEAISAAARTGKLGDGKLFISDVSDAIRIRNGDRGEGVL
jgi:nitrogen regulatory protein P-II 1